MPAPRSRPSRINPCSPAMASVRCRVRLLTKLKVPWEPTAVERAYNEGRSTQVPMTPRVRVRGTRFSRKLGYKGMELTIER